jgi:hypothetical protein
MTMNHFRFAAALMLLAPLPAIAQPAPAAAAASAYDADRADILGMAGNYKVKFDMQEATSWRADYTPIPVKVSGGFEAVRVIEDTGRVIRLQHLLVVDAGGKPMVIKHWRQDWEYEPARVLTYAGPDAWTWTALSPEQRKGVWSQNGRRWAAFAAGNRARAGVRSRVAMRSAGRSMTAISASTATRSRPPAGFTGRTISKWAKSAAS